MNTVTIQIQIEKNRDHSETPIFMESELATIYSQSKELASWLERYGYVRSQVYLNERVWEPQNDLPDR